MARPFLSWTVPETVAVTGAPLPGPPPSGPLLPDPPLLDPPPHAPSMQRPSTAKEVLTCPIANAFPVAAKTANRHIGRFVSQRCGGLNVCGRIREHGEHNPSHG